MTNNRTIFGLRSKDRGLVYEGRHSSYKEALTDAIQTHIDLTGIDLAGTDLQGINLDGIDLSNASFRHCNLQGANLSEAKFTNCDFSDAALFEACFCYTDLRHCNFRESRFGLTDFAQANIHHCNFSGISTFTSNFAVANSMSGTVFFHERDKAKMSSPPSCLYGFKYPVMIFDDRILLDGHFYEFGNHDLAEISDRWLLNMLARKNSIKG